MSEEANNEEQGRELPVAEHQSETRSAPEADTEADMEVEREASRKSRRSFIVGGITALAAVGGWEWLKTRREDDGVPWPLRRALESNEQFARDYFKGSRLAPTFNGAANAMPRTNGDIGLGNDFNLATWRLDVVGLAAPDKFTKPRAKNQNAEDGEDSADTFRDETTEEPVVHLTLDDIRALPRVELTTPLKCIEGWSDMGHWAGARFSDFINKYQPVTRSGNAPDVHNRPDDLVGYVSLATPDGEYYVGLDMASALHPQTLLVYEMGGKALTPEHGAPLRLFTPVKYGVKNLKRIGTIRFTDKRPADYWAERGYDWYAGH